MSLHLLLALNFPEEELYIVDKNNHLRYNLWSFKERYVRLKIVLLIFSIESFVN